MTQHFDTRDFRLQYMDLYSEKSDEAQNEESQVPGFFNRSESISQMMYGFGVTDEFPILADSWICCIIDKTIEDRHQQYGAKIDRKSPAKQGFAERVARSFGLTGVQVPSTFKERLSLRWKVFIMAMKEANPVVFY